MPILIEPLKRISLREILDLCGVTLVIREDVPDEWNAYMLDPSGVEYDLFEEWGIECEATARDSMEAVALTLSNDLQELGDLEIDCSDMRVEVGPQEMDALPSDLV